MASQLDEEIENLQNRVASLKRRLQLQTSTLLSAPSTQKLLTAEPRARKGHVPAQSALLAAVASQAAHNAQSLYRAVAGVTTFRARDPDPNAVDGGRLLGLRIEVVARARFLRPYYVLLNRPYAGAPALRVHRHTVPAPVPLAGLAARHLPAPAAGSSDPGPAGEAGAPRQDLSRFVHELRKEVARYHARLGSVADLRRAAGLEARTAKAKGKQRQTRPEDVVHVAPADAEAKQVEFGWADGRTGRMVLGGDGIVQSLVVFGENGRDRASARTLLAEGNRVEDVVRVLRAAST